MGKRNLSEVQGRDEHILARPSYLAWQNKQGFSGLAALETARGISTVALPDRMTWVGQELR